MHRRIFFFLCAALSLSGTHALAQDFESFRWRGMVDAVDEIDIRGDRIRVRHLEGQPIQQQDHRFTAPLPERDDLHLRLTKISGRGRVILAEEPSAWNDHTATIRIEDQASGADEYELELSWRREDWDDWDNNDWDTSDEWGDPFESRREGVFRWAGRVDIGADIEIRGERHRVNDRGGSGTQERQARFGAPLPATGAPVSLHKIDGRGAVMLVQPPNASNNYTAIVRIVDEDSGADDYEFELRWRTGSRTSP